MQRLLIWQEDEQLRLRTAKVKTDNVQAESLRREINLGKEVETLRSQMSELPEVKMQLVEAKSANALLQTEVEQLKAQLVEKKRKWSVLMHPSLQVRRKYLMTTGISQIVAKCRASHEFGMLVGRLTPSIIS